MAKISVKDIRKSLISQLEARKAATPFFLHMVDVYCDLFNQLNKLTASIKKSGIEIEEVYNSRGDKRKKENPLMKEQKEIIKQMLAILAQLKLNTETIIDENAEDEL